MKPFRLELFSLKVFTLSVTLFSLLYLQLPSISTLIIINEALSCQGLDIYDYIIYNVTMLVLIKCIKCYRM